jgi:hypothetical protein
MAEPKLRVEKTFILHKEGFNDITIRKWNWEDDTYEYDLLCHTFRNGDINDGRK